MQYSRDGELIAMSIEYVVVEIEAQYVMYNSC